MRLHDRIMNIQIADPMHKVQDMGRDGWLLYRQGHKDARHSAAELSLIADELLEVLEEVFIIGDRLVSDVYGSEFVRSAKAAIAKARGTEQ